MSDASLNHTYVPTQCQLNFCTRAEAFSDQSVVHRRSLSSLSEQMPVPTAEPG